MLDRLISGAGAVTDGADRSVRLRASGSRRGFATTRPGSLLVAIVLLLLAALLVLAGREATDPVTPASLAPAVVATARDLGDRTYATMTGSISTAYVETFEDANGNGIEDGGENGVAWYYWLVDPVKRTGVTVRSTRPPSEVYTFRGRGVLIPDPRFVTEDYAPFTEEIDHAGLRVDPATVLDTTGGTVGAPVPLDLAGTIPPLGTPVELSGSRTGAYVGVCSKDTNHDGRCDPDEQDAYEIIVFDPGTRRALRVLVREAPEFSDATLTGLLRREERAVDDALTTEGLAFGDLDLVVSPRYILDDAARPASARLAVGLGIVLSLVAGTILVGLAGGYLIYRRDHEGLPPPATTLALGERIPLRITGVVRTPTGREHVREVPGELVRFALGRRVPEAIEPLAAEPLAAESPDPLGLLDDTPIGSTLLVERVGYPQGVALGLGELSRISSGRVMAFRGPRPAVRVVAATGPLFLSFDTLAERDRAAAELLEETGLGPDGKRIRTP
jgi:hypothetical protein